MKKHRRYRPKGLSKEEKKYLNAMIKREIIMMLVVIAAGAAVVVAILAMVKEGASL